MNKMSHWKDSEIKALFHLVEEYKEKNLSLSHCFSVYASSTKRKPNSVRNYYYQELAYLEQNNDKRQKLKIDLTLHSKVIGKTFTDAEAGQLVSEIENLKKLGYSVRKACYKLANGEVGEMVRLQNKYRSVVYGNESKIKKTINTQVSSSSNLLMMPTKRNKLSDSDVNSLFMGLINLVKRNALEHADEKLKKDAETANDNLRKMIIALNHKEIEIKKLRQEFKLLENEKQIVCEKLSELRNKTATLLSKNIKNSKLSSLENFALLNGTSLKQKNS